MDTNRFETKGKLKPKRSFEGQTPFFLLSTHPKQLRKRELSFQRVSDSNDRYWFFAGGCAAASRIFPPLVNDRRFPAETHNNFLS
ncbi:hypothetical protein DdX_04096 [Ditylenchus destructor]|uniref:Uncharacterized protein n=1 Tax=Ditylenchus destructor TaxID=166010 RepID=A0AAD4NBB6_9BILA|nr:hypothetical protein DdX_04096 [Ditylenchus destructor]